MIRPRSNSRVQLMQAPLGKATSSGFKFRFSAMMGFLDNGKDLSNEMDIDTSSNRSKGGMSNGEITFNERRSVTPPSKTPTNRTTWNKRVSSMGRETFAIDDVLGFYHCVPQAVPTCPMPAVLKTTPIQSQNQSGTQCCRPTRKSSLRRTPAVLSAMKANSAATNLSKPGVYKSQQSAHDKLQDLLFAVELEIESYKKMPFCFDSDAFSNRSSLTLYDRRPSNS